jgi:methylmalonyl-CoA mutase C-terminal domain/subunit
MTNDPELLRPAKVLVTKIGMDGHDRGSRVIATALRDAGVEVVYTGPWQEIPVVAKLAMEEDVDVIGISSLAADHLLAPKLMARMIEDGLGHIRVVIGGIVPDDEEAMLLEAGVAWVFHPGADLADIVASIKSLAAQAQNDPARFET